LSSAFDEAKAKIAADLSGYFPEGERRGDDYYWRRRPEDDTPSCHLVPGTYQVKDFGDSEYRGSVLDCYAEQQGLTTEEAVEKVLGRPLNEGKAKRDKPAPRLPVSVPLRTLNPVAKGEAAVERHGQPVAGWTYHDTQGRPVFCVVRYERAGVKAVIPYYYGADERWHEGQPYKDDRPLYRLHEVLKSKLPVLVVEGEKCADVPVDGFIVTTWPSGSSAVAKADWSPLQKRDVLVWPDADEPGLKAAMAIKRRLPQARVLRIEGRPQGWDIADLVAEGGNPAAFIAECPTREVVEEAVNRHFAPLGFTDSHHWFLIKGQRVPMAIQRGGFNQSRLLELAPLAYWSTNLMTTDSGSVRCAAAQDYIAGISAAAGRYWPELLRGAGVWRESDGRIVVNDGLRIVLQDGTRVSYEDHQTGAHYLSADVRFGELAGEAAKDYEGARLLELFEAQNWSNPIYALVAMGWSLIAPFSGILHWRPHIWISGRKSTGKTWVLENLIRPLCGTFGYKGSGKDSEAGIRRSLRTDARPVVLDEMEPLDRRSQDKVAAILALARNASSDGSEYMTIAGPDGGVLQFRIRSCFCLASVNVLERGAAIDSRIMRLELRPLSKAEELEKETRTREYADVREDPLRFLRRTFQALPRVLEDIEFLKRSLLGQLGDMRQVDQAAPILAASWAALSEESIRKTAGQEWITKQFDGLAALVEDTVEDEDRVIEHILSAQVLTDDRTARTVGELLQVAEKLDSPESVVNLLERTGLRLMENGNGEMVLAVSAHSDQIARILAGTPYEHGYDAQLRRHPLCLDIGAARQVRVAGVNTRCRCLDWERFKARYMAEPAEAPQPDLWEGKEK